IAKVALGAETLVDWEQGEILEVVQELKKRGVNVYGLETGEGAINIVDFPETEKEHLALVLGNEVEGIEEAVLNLLDGKIVIPMQKKRSLNVAVASGVAMYALNTNRHD